MARAAARLGASAAVVDDARLRDGGDWDAGAVADACRGRLAGLLAGARAAAVVTFDAAGASRHPNHVATWRGLVALRASWGDEKAPRVDWLALESAPFYRKFLGALDVLVAPCRAARDGRPSLLVANFDVRAAYAALAAHASQLVWFRRLFLLFSSYTYLNRLADLR